MAGRLQLAMFVSQLLARFLVGPDEQPQAVLLCLFLPSHIT